MRTMDEHVMGAPAATCFAVAADVERWPELLPHYRWVRRQRPGGGAPDRVEMAAWRDFGAGLRYPVWWVSDMRVLESRPAILYTHVAGITTGMEVEWRFEPRADGTAVCITHAWDGPGWPVFGRFAAERVIGPHFVSAIARRTLVGVGLEAERRARGPGTARTEAEAE